jgi:Putative Ig domain
MNARWSLVGVALLCALGLIASCRFEPDLSRFEMCAGDGSCAQGFSCLTEVQRCLPDCGVQSTCPTEPPPDASTDAGTTEDGGSDAGTDAGSDAGTDAGSDGGADAGLPLSVVTEVLALAVENVPYSMELQAQGGMPPYQFRATSSLPQGLTLDAGILSGTPSTQGTFRVAVEVSDSDTPPAHVDAGYDLRVRPQLLVAGPEALMDGYPNKAYTEKISAIGGIPLYRFSLVPPSTVPAPGLTLLEDGTVTGTPSSNGTYSFTVRVTDSDLEQPQTATLPLSVTIKASPLLLTISNQSVPDGRMGTSYQYVLRTAPSAGATWRFKEGNLPPGIGFYPDSAVLSGAPIASGSFTFVIGATDGLLGNTEADFTLEVH